MMEAYDQNFLLLFVEKYSQHFLWQNDADKGKEYFSDLLIFSKNPGLFSIRKLDLFKKF